MICPVCHRTQLTELPHVHLPDPDPLFVPEQPVRRRVESDSRMPILFVVGAILTGIAIAGFIVAFWIARPPEAKAADDDAAIGSVIIAGGINYADRELGDRYLAVRAPRGTLVNLCGPAACVTMRSTDVGPVAHHGKIADVALEVWSIVCGIPEDQAPIIGVCAGNAEYPYDGPTATLPPTDAEASADPGTVAIAEGPGSRIGWLALIMAVLFPGVMLVLRRSRR